MVLFIKKFYRIAIAVAKEFRLCPIFILAVAGIETGFGKSVKGNNYFGIKATSSWTGKVQDFSTHEYLSDGKKYKLKDYFRAYDTPLESFQDFGRLITKLYPQCVGVYDKSVCKLINSNPKRCYSTAPYYGRILTSVYIKIIEYLQDHPDMNYNHHEIHSHSP